MCNLSYLTACLTACSTSLWHPMYCICAQALKASEAMHALKRVGEPDEVAAALEFLLLPTNR